MQVNRLMDIKEFFHLSAGKWFAHRTIHDLTSKKPTEAKSEIVIEELTTNAAEVIQLCELYQIQPNQASCGVKATWNDTTKLNQKNTGSVVLVLVPNSDNQEEGKFLRSIANGEKPVAGNYKLGTDESLTLITKSETVDSEERMWFASPNLRMRVSIIKQSDSCSMTSFTSEIRMGVTTPAKETSTANSASN
jgi:CpeS-like protein